MTVRKSSKKSDTNNPNPQPHNDNHKETDMKTATTTDITEKKSLHIVPLPLSIPVELWFSGYDTSKLLTMAVNPGHEGGDMVQDPRMTLKAAYALKDLVMGVWNVPTRGLHLLASACCDDDAAASKLYKDVAGVIGPSYDGSDRRFPRITDEAYHLIRLINGQHRVDRHALPDGMELKHIFIEMFLEAMAIGKTVYIKLGRNKPERVAPIYEQLILASQDKAAARQLRVDHLQNRETAQKVGRMNNWAAKPENKEAAAAQTATVLAAHSDLPTSGLVKVEFTSGMARSTRNFNLDLETHRVALANQIRLNPNYKIVS